MRAGQIERRTHHNTRHGTTSLCAAIDVKRGNVIGQCQSRRRAREFRRFLDTIEADGLAVSVHLILNHDGAPKAPAIHPWLAQRPRYHVPFTPTSAFWINLVERWFGVRDRKQLRRGNYHGTAELIAAIMRYVATSNIDPKRFAWTKTARDILASSCQRHSNLADHQRRWPGRREEHHALVCLRRRHPLNWNWSTRALATTKDRTRLRVG
jgi:hypothetical protein